MSWLQDLGNHPWLAGALVLVVALLVYALVKRLLTLAILLLVVVAALLAWFRLTGREVPDDVDRLARGAGRLARGAVEHTGEIIRQGEEALDTPPAAKDTL
jgi:hypothetical protein